MDFDDFALSAALSLLEGRLRLNGAPPVRLVICGGSALIALHLVTRTTRDVDVLALVDSQKHLATPAPLPDCLLQATGEVAAVLGLPEDWVNNGPSANSGGLFQMGLPEGLLERAHQKDYGSHLSIFFIDRTDQIYPKVFAAVDRLGVHIDDLLTLKPTSDELEKAARWCMTHDPSEPFKGLLKSVFEQLGYRDASERL